MTRTTRELDLARLRRERFAKLQAGMQRRGLGVERPLASGLAGPEPQDEPLAEGMALALQGHVWERGVGGYPGLGTVVVGATGPERLTRLSAGPLSAGN